MRTSFLSGFPSYIELKKIMNGTNLPPFREANSHIHSPWSFSAFDKMETAFLMAKDEKISLLGINDFFVADGYDEFNKGCLKYGIFPLFNIEFIGLLKEEQKKGIRINDPKNPGRIYFCGKGLDYPFNPGWLKKIQLNIVIRESQNQMKEMTSRLNHLIGHVNPSLAITYEEIKKRFTHGLVRERHLAKAIRYLAIENFKTSGDQLDFLESLYSGKKSEVRIVGSVST